ncbi:MAG: hypothetical protein WC028_02275 [Candidatus Obscuribacterales bacterium]
MPTVPSHLPVFPNIFPTNGRSTMTFVKQAEVKFKDDPAKLKLKILYRVAVRD